MTHRVVMNFMLNRGWHVSFLEADARTVLPLKLAFKTEDKVREMFDRFGQRYPENERILEHGLNIGRGSVWLEVAEEQYQKLRRVRRLVDCRRVNVSDAVII